MYAVMINTECNQQKAIKQIKQNHYTVIILTLYNYNLSIRLRLVLLMRLRAYTHTQHSSLYFRSLGEIGFLNFNIIFIGQTVYCTQNIYINEKANLTNY